MFQIRAVSLRHRNLQGELMDAPDLAPREHVAALCGLQRINRVTNSTRVLWRAIRKIHKKSGMPLNVMDVACGGGDVLCDLAERARRAKVPVHFTGWDLSPTAIERTQSLARHKNVKVETKIANALTESFPADQDVIYCSLFLHHLSCEDAGLLLRRMAESARMEILVSDLVRSRSGFVMAWLGTRLLSRSRIVHVDGPRSVEAAFTLPEINDLAAENGLQDATCQRFWPQRFLLSWSPAANAK